ncbi:hypothetical protein IMZ48_03170 [Candidatus Bathyarchaeota archaeon]|nr:hypothetical protein [Candidatus Bathyarchaeota archaeon]
MLNGDQCSCDGARLDGDMAHGRPLGVGVRVTNLNWAYSDDLGARAIVARHVEVRHGSVGRVRDGRREVQALRVVRGAVLEVHVAVEVRHVGGADVGCVVVEVRAEVGVVEGRLGGSNRWGDCCGDCGDVCSSAALGGKYLVAVSVVGKERMTLGVAECHGGVGRSVQEHVDVLRGRSYRGSRELLLMGLGRAFLLLSFLAVGGLLQNGAVTSLGRINAVVPLLLPGVMFLDAMALSIRMAVVTLAPGLGPRAGVAVRVSVGPRILGDVLDRNSFAHSDGARAKGNGPA